jgi:hypothetical protein
MKPTMMNKIVLCVGIFLFTTTLFAQKGKWEKIHALKVAYITERLELTENEAKVFWPIYNENRDKMHGLGKRKFKEIFGKIEAGGLSETEADALMTELLQIDAKEKELNKKFYTKIASEVSSVKACKLMKAEEDFKRELMREFRQKQKGKPQP